MAADPVVEAIDLRVERRGRTILTGISLTVESGSRLLIQGPSGAGKTTLFRVLGLLEPPTAGRLLIAGTETASLSERQRARLRRDTLGVVFQGAHLVPDLTVRENVRLPQEHRRGADPAWIESLLDRLAIAEQADQYPATLSGGERQRVAVARALANRPAVVLADEPTGHLDPDTASRVLELLLERHAPTETALVVVSHDRSIAERFETVRRLVDGRFADAGDVGGAAAPE